MNSHYRIREATAEDIPVLIELIDGVFDEYDWSFDQDIEVPDFVHFQQFYNQEGGLPCLLVACTKQDDKAVACAALKPDNRGVYLSRIYVTKAHRRQGLARALINKLINRASTLDIHYVHLWTDTQFNDAHKLYESLEFLFTGHARPLNDPNNCYEYHYERLI